MQRSAYTFALCLAVLLVVYPKTTTGFLCGDGRREPDCAGCAGNGTAGSPLRVACNSNSASSYANGPYCHWAPTTAVPVSHSCQPFEVTDFAYIDFAIYGLPFSCPVSDLSRIAFEGAATAALGRVAAFALGMTNTGESWNGLGVQVPPQARRQLLQQKWATAFDCGAGDARTLPHVRFRLHLRPHTGTYDMHDMALYVGLIENALAAKKTSLVFMNATYPVVEHVRGFGVAAAEGLQLERKAGRDQAAATPGQGQGSDRLPADAGPPTLAGQPDDPVPWTRASCEAAGHDWIKRKRKCKTNH